MKIKQFVLNAMNSWVTSSLGAIAGVPLIWEGLKPLLDDDPATGIVWKVLLTGIGALFGGLMMRDWTKAIVPSERHPDGGK